MPIINFYDGLEFRTSKKQFDKGCFFGLNPNASVYAYVCSLIFNQLALLIEFKLELELYADCGDFFQVQVFQLATRSTTHRSIRQT